MTKKAIFTMKLEAQLRDEFMAAATDNDRPASQVVRQLMRDYIRQQRQAHEYEQYLRQKVEAGRASVAADRGSPNDDVEAEFAARRSGALANRA